jgi:hypothetical protein
MAAVPRQPDLFAVVGFQCDHDFSFRLLVVVENKKPGTRPGLIF